MSTWHGAVTEMILVLAVLSGSGCSSSPTCLECPATGGGGVFGAGGTPILGGAAGALPGAGGTPSAGGVATANGGTPGAAGTMSTPAGSLMCGGKLCKGGGHCATDGSCPAYLGTCFTSTDNFATCDAYCNAQGAACNAKACNADGTAIMNGYSWVSYSASDRAECQMGAFPDANSFDTCASPIWLAPSKPKDDVIRCCCKDY
ncbi:MAG TPA: hypothetical protein VH062_22235 [Polyangiaceae bacterium]|jgi:hypothetical protein|nr:hypothetical protein [Polyangiaceae bacterium]